MQALEIYADGASELKTVSIDIGHYKSVDLSYAFYNAGLIETSTKRLSIIFRNADNDIPRQFSNAFSHCQNLDELPAVNCAHATGLNTAFDTCTSLKRLGFYNISTDIYLGDSTMMTRESLLEVLNNLATVTSDMMCALGETNLAKLTDEDKAIATNKGWTLA